MERSIGMEEPIKVQFAFLVMIGTLSFAGLSGGAHHSFETEFDRDSPMEFDATVSRFELVNPHAYLYVDVTGDSGEVATWVLQMGAPGTMVRFGWSSDSISAGDAVHIVGWLARESTDYRGVAHSVTLPNGETLQASRAFQRRERR